jgi:uncharacterized protein (TIGR03435 family)
MTRHLMILTVLTVAAVTLQAEPPRRQAEARPTFEVASVKPNSSGEFGASYGGRPGQVTVRNGTLRNIVRNTYGVQDFQIVGGPEWFDKDRFDISARASTEAPQPQMLLMMQSLLAERFKLIAHMETRQLPIYALVMAREGNRPGPQLTASATDCAALAAGRGAPPPAQGGTGRPACGTRSTPGRILAGGVSMSDLSRNLANFAGRFVTDRTGLTGRWDLELQWTPEPGLMPVLPPNAPPLPVPDPNGPSLFTAVQEQLGLKLESQRGPVEVLVIDSAERPSPD